MKLSFCIAKTVEIGWTFAFAASRNVSVIAAEQRHDKGIVGVQTEPGSCSRGPVRHRICASPQRQQLVQAHGAQAWMVRCCGRGGVPRGLPGLISPHLLLDSDSDALSESVALCDWRPRSHQGLDIRWR